MFIQGILTNGNTVAVKKLMIAQSHTVKEHFESEVKAYKQCYRQKSRSLAWMLQQGLRTVARL